MRMVTVVEPRLAVTLAVIMGLYADQQLRPASVARQLPYSHPHDDGSVTASRVRRPVPCASPYLIQTGFD